MAVSSISVWMQLLLFEAETKKMICIGCLMNAGTRIKVSDQLKKQNKKLCSQRHGKAPRRNFIFTAENLCKIGWGKSGLNDP